MLTEYQMNLNQENKEIDISSGDLTNSNHGLETLTHGLESGKSLEKSNECSVRLQNWLNIKGPTSYGGNCNGYPRYTRKYRGEPYVFTQM